ncbi:vomeronasal type-1 receptor 4-like [Meles meles]|uniref:vomeronasal type-1 receptor 4-like n=1 Tax=Meles meles TaxID=9662 RepID=UPI001E69C2EC|nr:vomeronasal type-1 receptor 4-like [Meles meles]
MLNDRISSRDLIMGIIFLSLMIVGIVGNFFLLYHYLFLFHTKCRVRCTHLILKHLVISNSLVILSKGVPQTMKNFGLKHFSSKFGCKLLLYVQRVSRGVSISSICLLSVFQAIMISPMNSCWQDLKVKAPKYVGLSISLCWIMYIFINLIFHVYVLYVSDKWSIKNITNKGDLWYCFTIDHETITAPMYALLIILSEVSFSGLMIWACGSMVFILHRHRQRVQHIHRHRQRVQHIHRPNNVSPRSSAESRATQSILVLVTTFMSSYFLSSIFHACIAFIYNPRWWLVNTAVVISVCFPTVSPFLLMSQDSAIPRLSFSWIRNIKSFNCTRKK